MELALFTEPQFGGTYQNLLDLARWSEEQGLDAFARSDHYLNGSESAPATDALTSIAGLARDTETIELVVLVSPLTFRHPGVLAKTAATIDEMSGGRFALGVGTGWMEGEHDAFGIELYSMRERFSRLFETLSYVRAAFAGTEGFSGRHYTLAATTDVLPRPTNVRIVIGGSGSQKTPTLAGRFADEYNMGVTDPESLERRLDVMRRAAADADRDPDAIKISIAGPAIIADTEQEYRDLLAERGAKRDLSADEYEAFLGERNVPRGTLETAGEAIAAYESLGVSRYYLQELKALDEVDTDRLGPVFRALRG
ncbi:MAG: LLM class F420-dependent oxidoreductase [Acidimicrobiia bacterium]|nr:MAG: LLM class F420-dependent oxidoreductase [Acidimicrobiia bacterium]